MPSSYINCAISATCRILVYLPVIDVLVGYETVSAGWNSSRRCGYRCYSGYNVNSDTWFYWTAGTSGSENISSGNTYESRCNCTLKGGPYTFGSNGTNLYGAVCVAGDAAIVSVSAWKSWATSQTCPKGWGKGVKFKSSGSNYVQHAQGYVNSTYQEPIYEEQQTGTKPVYGYVTRYRTVYYNYLGVRVAKS